MNKAILKLYLKIFGRESLRKFNRLLLILGLKGLGLTNYQDNTISGEDFALEKIKGILSNRKEKIIFDIGANIGEYSEQSRKVFGKQAKIYSFEPTKGSFEQLKKRSLRINNIPYNIGFSDKKGKATIYYEEGNSKSPHSSLYKEVIGNIHSKKFSKEIIKLEVLDKFCEENSLGEIDFLKIDVEGHELNVLKGAKRMIENNKIKIIQFEFNEMNLISRTNMLDFMEILKDYKLYRIQPYGLAIISPQDIENRIFLFQNILAVNKQINK